METSEVEKATEYMRRFQLRELIEQWTRQVSHERPSDPFDYLVRSAIAQRTSGGGVVTCPNNWCQMSMPAAQFESHFPICSNRDFWERCARCNERIEASKYEQHKRMCQVLQCRYCGETILPRMQSLCPMLLRYEAERDRRMAEYERQVRLDAERIEAQKRKEEQEQQEQSKGIASASLREAKGNQPHAATGSSSTGTGSCSSSSSSSSSGSSRSGSRSNSALLRKSTIKGGEESLMPEQRPSASNSSSGGGGALSGDNIPSPSASPHAFRTLGAGGTLLHHHHPPRPHSHLPSVGTNGSPLTSDGGSADHRTLPRQPPPPSFPAGSAVRDEDYSSLESGDQPRDHRDSSPHSSPNWNHSDHASSPNIHSFHSPPPHSSTGGDSTYCSTQHPPLLISSLHQPPPPPLPRPSCSRNDTSTTGGDGVMESSSFSSAGISPPIGGLHHRHPTTATVCSDTQGSHSTARPPCFLSHPSADGPTAMDEREGEDLNEVEGEEAVRGGVGALLLGADDASSHSAPLFFRAVSTTTATDEGCSPPLTANETASMMIAGWTGAGATPPHPAGDSMTGSTTSTSQASPLPPAMTMTMATMEGHPSLSSHPREEYPSGGDGGAATATAGKGSTSSMVMMAPTENTTITTTRPQEEGVATDTSHYLNDCRISSSSPSPPPHNDDNRHSNRNETNTDSASGKKKTVMRNYGGNASHTVRPIDVVAGSGAGHHTTSGTNDSYSCSPPSLVAVSLLSSPRVPVDDRGSRGFHSGTLGKCGVGDDDAMVLTPKKSKEEEEKPKATTSGGQGDDDDDGLPHHRGNENNSPHVPGAEAEMEDAPRGAKSPHLPGFEPPPLLYRSNTPRPPAAGSGTASPPGRPKNGNNGDDDADQHLPAAAHARRHHHPHHHHSRHSRHHTHHSRPSHHHTHNADHPSETEQQHDIRTTPRSSAAPPSEIRKKLKEMPEHLNESLKLVQNLWRHRMSRFRYRDYVFERVWNIIDASRESVGATRAAVGTGQLLHELNQELLRSREDLCIGSPLVVMPSNTSPRSNESGGYVYGGFSRRTSMASSMAPTERTPSQGETGHHDQDAETGNHDGRSFLTSLTPENNDHSKEEENRNTDEGTETSTGENDALTTTNRTTEAEAAAAATAAITTTGEATAVNEGEIYVRVLEEPNESGAYMDPEDFDLLVRVCAARRPLHRVLVRDLVRTSTAIMRERRHLVEHLTIPPGGECVIVGDLHGQLKDLLHIFRIMGYPSYRRVFLFNGDYVDRGAAGCEVIVLILAMLCAYPDYVYINRGNHEDYRTNTEHGFVTELLAKFGPYAADIHHCLVEAYASMTLMTVVDQRVAVVHGGVPRFPCTVEEISKLPYVQDVPVVQQFTREDNLLVDLLWNDPVEKYRSRQLGMRHQGDGWRKSKRGCGAEYLKNITEQFLHLNKLSLVIRSHDMARAGFEELHKNQSITIFSASDYCGVAGNRGAIAVLTRGSKRPVYHTWFVRETTTTLPMQFALSSNAAYTAFGPPSLATGHESLRPIGLPFSNGPFVPEDDEDDEFEFYGDEFLDAFYSEFNLARKKASVMVLPGSTVSRPHSSSPNWEEYSVLSHSGIAPSSLSDVEGSGGHHHHPHPQHHSQQPPPPQPHHRMIHAHHPPSSTLNSVNINSTSHPAITASTGGGGVGIGSSSSGRSGGLSPLASPYSTPRGSAMIGGSIAGVPSGGAAAAAADGVVDALVGSTSTSLLGGAHGKAVEPLGSSLQHSFALHQYSARGSEVEHGAGAAMLATTNSLQNSMPSVYVSMSDRASILRQQRTIQDIREMIFLNRYTLLATFNQVDELRAGVVYKAEWCNVMRDVLGLELPWYYISDFVLPKLTVDGIASVRYVTFLQHFDAPFSDTFRESWQVHTLRHIFSYSDLPDDIITTFADADVCSPQRSRASSVEPEDIATSSATSRKDASHHNVQPLRSNNSSVSTVGRNDGGGGPDTPVISGKPEWGYSKLNGSQSRLLPKMGGSKVGGGGAESVCSCLTGELTPHWRYRLIDFRTFAAKIRQVSPTSANMEDNEIYCIFQFFDREQRGHVYLGEMCDYVENVLQGAQSDRDEEEEVVQADDDLGKLLGATSYEIFAEVAAQQAARMRPPPAAAAGDESAADQLVPPAPLLPVTTNTIAQTVELSEIPCSGGGVHQSRTNIMNNNSNNSGNSVSGGDGGGATLPVIATTTAPAIAISAAQLNLDGTISSAKDSSSSSASPNRMRQSSSSSHHRFLSANTRRQGGLLSGLLHKRNATNSSHDNNGRQLPSLLTAGSPKSNDGPPSTTATTGGGPRWTMTNPPNIKTNNSGDGSSSGASGMVHSPTEQRGDLLPTTSDTGVHHSTTSTTATTVLDGLGNMTATMTTNPSVLQGTQNTVHDSFMEYLNSPAETLSSVAGGAGKAAVLRERAWMYHVLLKLQEQLLGNGNTPVHLSTIFRTLNQSRDGKLRLEEFQVLLHLGCLSCEQEISDGAARLLFNAVRDGGMERMNETRKSRQPNNKESDQLWAEMQAARESDEAQCGFTYILRAEFVSMFMVVTPKPPTDDDDEAQEGDYEDDVIASITDADESVEGGVSTGIAAASSAGMYSNGVGSGGGAIYWAATGPNNSNAFNPSESAQFRRIMVTPPMLGPASASSAVFTSPPLTIGQLMEKFGPDANVFDALHALPSPTGVTGPGATMMMLLPHTPGGTMSSSGGGTTTAVLRIDSTSSSGGGGGGVNTTQQMHGGPHGLNGHHNPPSPGASSSTAGGPPPLLLSPCQPHSPSPAAPQKPPPAASHTTTTTTSVSHLNHSSSAQSQMLGASLRRVETPPSSHRNRFNASTQGGEDLLGDFAFGSVGQVSFVARQQQPQSVRSGTKTPHRSADPIFPGAGANLSRRMSYALNQPTEALVSVRMPLPGPSSSQGAALLLPENTSGLASPHGFGFSGSVAGSVAGVQMLTPTPRSRSRRPSLAMARESSVMGLGGGDSWLPSPGGSLRQSMPVDGGAGASTASQMGTTTTSGAGGLVQGAHGGSFSTRRGPGASVTARAKIMERSKRSVDNRQGLLQQSGSMSTPPTHLSTNNIVGVGLMMASAQGSNHLLPQAPVSPGPSNSNSIEYNPQAGADLTVRTSGSLVRRSGDDAHFTIATATPTVIQAMGTSGDVVRPRDTPPANPTGTTTTTTSRSTGVLENSFSATSRHMGSPDLSVMPPAPPPLSASTSQRMLPPGVGNLGSASSGGMGNSGGSAAIAAGGSGGGGGGALHTTSSTSSSHPSNHNIMVNMAPASLPSSAGGGSAAVRPSSSSFLLQPPSATPPQPQPQQPPSPLPLPHRPQSGGQSSVGLMTHSNKDGGAVSPPPPTCSSMLMPLGEGLLTDQGRTGSFRRWNAFRTSPNPPPQAQGMGHRPASGDGSHNAVRIIQDDEGHLCPANPSTHNHSSNSTTTTTTTTTTSALNSNSYSYTNHHSNNNIMLNHDSAAPDVHVQYHSIQLGSSCSISSEQPSSSLTQQIPRPRPQSQSQLPLQPQQPQQQTASQQTPPRPPSGSARMLTASTDPHNTAEPPPPPLLNSATTPSGSDGAAATATGCNTPLPPIHPRRSSAGFEPNPTTTTNSTTGPAPITEGTGREEPLHLPPPNYRSDNVHTNSPMIYPNANNPTTTMTTLAPPDSLGEGLGGGGHLTPPNQQQQQQQQQHDNNAQMTATAVTTATTTSTTMIPMDGTTATFSVCDQQSSEMTQSLTSTRAPAGTPSVQVAPMSTTSLPTTNTMLSSVQNDKICTPCSPPPAFTPFSDLLHTTGTLTTTTAAPAPSIAMPPLPQPPDISSGGGGWSSVAIPRNRSQSAERSPFADEMQFLDGGSVQALERELSSLSQSQLSQHNAAAGGGGNPGGYVYNQYYYHQPQTQQHAPEREGADPAAATTTTTIITPDSGEPLPQTNAINPTATSDMTMSSSTTAAGTGGACEGPSNSSRSGMNTDAHQPTTQDSSSSSHMYILPTVGHNTTTAGSSTVEVVQPVPPAPLPPALPPHHNGANAPGTMSLSPSSHLFFPHQVSPNRPCPPPALSTGQRTMMTPSATAPDAAEARLHQSAECHLTLSGFLVPPPPPSVSGSGCGGLTGGGPSSPLRSTDYFCWSTPDPGNLPPGLLSTTVPGCAAPSSITSNSMFVFPPVGGGTTTAGAAAAAVAMTVHNVPPPPPPPPSKFGDLSSSGGKAVVRSDSPLQLAQSSSSSNTESHQNDHPGMGLFPDHHHHHHQPQPQREGSSGRHACKTNEPEVKDGNMAPSLTTTDQTGTDISPSSTVKEAVSRHHSAATPPTAGTTTTPSAHAEKEPLSLDFLHLPAPIGGMGRTESLKSTQLPTSPPRTTTAEMTVGPATSSIDTPNATSNNPHKKRISTPEVSSPMETISSPRPHTSPPPCTTLMVTPSSTPTSMLSPTKSQSTPSQQQQQPQQKQQKPSPDSEHRNVEGLMRMPIIPTAQVLHACLQHSSNDATNATTLVPQDTCSPLLLDSSTDRAPQSGTVADSGLGLGLGYHNRLAHPSSSPFRAPYNVISGGSGGGAGHLYSSSLLGPTTATTLTASSVVPGTSNHTSSDNEVFSIPDSTADTCTLLYFSGGSLSSRGMGSARMLGGLERLSPLRGGGHSPSSLSIPKQPQQSQSQSMHPSPFLSQNQTPSPLALGLLPPPYGNSATTTPTPNGNANTNSRSTSGCSTGVERSMLSPSAPSSLLMGGSGRAHHVVVASSNTTNNSNNTNNNNNTIGGGGGGVPSNISSSDALTLPLPTSPRGHNTGASGGSDDHQATTANSLTTTTTMTTITTTTTTLLTPLVGISDNSPCAVLLREGGSGSGGPLETLPLESDGGGGSDPLTSENELASAGPLRKSSNPYCRGGNSAGGDVGGSAASASPPSFAKCHANVSSPPITQQQQQQQQQVSSQNVNGIVDLNHVELLPPTPNHANNIYRDRKNSANSAGDQYSRAASTVTLPPHKARSGRPYRKLRSNHDDENENEDDKEMVDRTPAGTTTAHCLGEEEGLLQDPGSGRGGGLGTKSVLTLGSSIDSISSGAGTRPATVMTVGGESENSRILNELDPDGSSTAPLTQSNNTSARPSRQYSNPPLQLHGAAAAVGNVVVGIVGSSPDSWENGMITNPSMTAGSWSTSDGGETAIHRSSQNPLLSIPRTSSSTIAPTPMTSTSTATTAIAAPPPPLNSSSSNGARSGTVTGNDDGNGDVLPSFLGAAVAGSIMGCSNSPPGEGRSGSGSDKAVFASLPQIPLPSSGSSGSRFDGLSHNNSSSPNASNNVSPPQHTGYNGHSNGNGNPTSTITVTTTTTTTSGGGGVKEAAVLVSESDHGGPSSSSSSPPTLRASSHSSSNGGGGSGGSSHGVGSGHAGGNGLDHLRPLYALPVSSPSPSPTPTTTTIASDSTTPTLPPPPPTTTSTTTSTTTTSGNRLSGGLRSVYPAMPSRNGAKATTTHSRLQQPSPRGLGGLPPTTTPTPTPYSAGGGTTASGTSSGSSSIKTPSHKIAHVGLTDLSLPLELYRASTTRRSAKKAVSVAVTQQLPPHHHTGDAEEGPCVVVEVGTLASCSPLQGSTGPSTAPTNDEMPTTTTQHANSATAGAGQPVGGVGKGGSLVGSSYPPHSRARSSSLLGGATQQDRRALVQRLLKMSREMHTNTTNSNVPITSGGGGGGMT